MLDQPKILIVDDEEINLMILEEMLSTNGYSVVKATNGPEALRKTSEENPDLLLMDIKMPDMDGYEATRRLKEKESSLTIPIVMLSALDDRRAKIEALEAGAEDFLRKPFDKVELLTRVKSLVGKKRLRDQEQAYLELIKKEMKKSESLLLNVLPEPIVNRLKKRPGIIAENYSEVTVLFADIVGFTVLASKIPPIKLVTLLNEVFSAFDTLADKFELEKIKTIGDAYMVVGGIPEGVHVHVEAMANMALEMSDEILKHPWPDGVHLKMRIGMHTGPVTAGVIGVKKYVFDLWGDTVNIASRMESQGVPGNIQVSHTTYQRLQNKYLFEKRGPIFVKGKGEMQTYFLIGKKGSRQNQLIFEEIKQKGEASYGLSRASEEIKTFPLIDPMTGLLSRNGFLPLAKQQLRIASREDRRILLMLIRLDSLEWINTTHGMDEGDRALIEVVKLINQTFRTSDLICRISSNLFLIFGLEKSQSEDDILKCRFCDILDDFEKQNSLNYPLPLSCTTYFWDSKSPETLEEMLSSMEHSLRKS